MLRLYQVPRLQVTPEAEEFYREIRRFQQQSINLGISAGKGHRLS